MESKLIASILIFITLHMFVAAGEPLYKERIKYIKEKYGIVCPAPEPYQPKEIPLNKLIDHTQLAGDALPDQIKKLCDEAKQYNFAAVCVNPCYAKLASSYLKGTDVNIACVIDFPLGCSSTESKVHIALDAIKNGANEIDMVINVGFMKAGYYDLVYEDIKQIANACHEHNAHLKVIIEATCLEKDVLIVDACLLSAAAGADFVKTSTGTHATGGAKPEHVKLMRETVGGKLGVKAAGGIRTKEDALKMIEAGCDRIGASKGIKIVTS